MTSRKPTTRLEPLRDGSRITISRGRQVEQVIRLGPNQVHAFITHNPGCGHGGTGEIEDLGISANLLITASAGGRDHASAVLGGLLATGGQGSPATASSATSFTATGTPWTTNLLAGMQAIFPITNLTTTPVLGRIISNTTSVATIDQWSTPTDTVGTTPASTSAFFIAAGGAPARYMALTENAAAANAADTVLTGEITTGGCGRALATYAHTLASATHTLQKVFSVTASFPAIHKMGIFPFVTVFGTLFYESVLNADANVVNLDSLTVTDTITVS